MPPPGKRRAGPGTEGEGSRTCPHLPPPRMCSVRSTLNPTIFHPVRDKQVPSMKLLRWLTVSLPIVTAEAPTVLSLHHCLFICFIGIVAIFVIMEVIEIIQIFDFIAFI